MRLWRTLLLLSICGLVLVSITKCEPAVEEGNDDDDDEGQVEVEEEDEPVVEDAPREKPKYTRPVPKVPVFFHEPFDSKESFSKRWVLSEAKKDGADELIAKYDGKWEVTEPKSNPIEGDLGLILKSKAKHHAVSSELEKPFDFKGKPLVVQYEVRFQNGMDCGGAYIKLLSKEGNSNLKTFNDKSPYTIMFGPDKCGMDNKLHFIFRHKNPKTGEVEEKHAKKPTANIDNYFTDRKTHLYTLVVSPDQTFEIRIDNGVVNKGSLLEDFSPPVNPTREIEDPNDKKPEDWDDREKIADPDATKPDDWDENEPSNIIDPDATKPDGWLDNEPRLVPDPEATKPNDWDDEMDGEWEAPLIDNLKCKEAPGCGEWEAPSIANPKYRGKWKASMIDNPNYKGVWKPRMIENPAYFEDENPYMMTPIGALGLELWSMSDEIMFDNFLITDDLKVAEEFSAVSWEIKSNEERAASSAGRTIVEAIKEVTDERPWLWAVFIIVVVLPIVLIVAYCCMSKGIWQTLMSSAEQRPWLWAVYVVVLLLPIVLLSICLCPKAGPIKPEDLDAGRKKTDEPSPDDEEEEEEVEGEGEKKADVGAGGDSGGEKKSSQADLEASEDAVDEGEEADAEEDEDAKASPKIADPDATKPDDWDENEPSNIIDPDATKPDGWLDNEPRLVPDPEATKPNDWDDEMDGEWEAPLIDNLKCKEAPGCGEWEAPSIANPKYRGKWKASMIDNPNYKGVWKPRMIENPAYFEDENPYMMTPIGALGLELWSMSDEIMFDNFLITDDLKVAEEFSAVSWEIKSNEERAASSAGRTIVEAIKEVTDERPWLWAVFIIVVVLPIVLIVAYCCMSKGIWQTLMSSAEQRPWLWAVYVVVLLLPIVLLSICLCPKAGPIKPEDLDAGRKKTDEPSPDDEEEEEEVEGEGEKKADVGAGGDSGGEKKSSQADLEASEDAVDEGEEADAEEDEDAKASPKKSPRRRKVRKE